MQNVAILIYSSSNSKGCSIDVHRLPISISHQEAPIFHLSNQDQEISPVVLLNFSIAHLRVL